MTQNNEREALLNKFREIIAEQGLQCRDMTEKLIDAAYAHIQSPISQNEQQLVAAEVVVNDSGQISIRNSDGSVFDISKHVGEKFYLSPPKQIPDGWKPSKKEILKYASEEELFLFADESDLLEIANGILELVQIKINTAPTTSLTSETNTEVGE